MTNLPNEIINIIMHFVEKPKHTELIHTIVKNYYELDYDPFWFETSLSTYSFEYSFKEWYFLYRNQMKYLHKQKYRQCKKNKYMHTPRELIIGADKLKVDIF
jgi:hypothetical protein